MSTLGIDPSVRAPAFACWPSCHTERIEVIGEGSSRLLSLYGTAHDWAALHAPDDLEAVFIERPFGRFAKQALDQACGVLQVAVLHALREKFPHPVSCFELPVGTWKREAIGNGAAKKADVIEWAERVSPPQGDPSYPLTSDEADALGVACAGAYLLKRGEAA